MAYVYSHIRKDNSKCFYIGKGKGNRAFETASRNPYWQNVAAKGYDVIFLVNNVSDDKALELERDFISQIGLDNLTNYHPGGQGGFDDEMRRKAGLARRGTKFTKFHKKNISKALKNHVRTEEHSKSISESKKGNNPHTAKNFGSTTGKDNGRYGTGVRYREVTTGIEGYSFDMKEAFPGIQNIHIYAKSGPIQRGKFKGLQFIKL